MPAGTTIDPPPLARVFTVLVNFQNWPQTVACTRMLALAGHDPAQIVVVDNASANGSADRLAAMLPEAILRPSPRNLGFAGGCNVGIEAALACGAQAVLLMNSDTLFGPEFLVCLLRGVDIATACVSPEIFRCRAPGRLWFGGAWDGRWPGTLRLRRAGDPQVVVDYLWACCMLVGREVWSAVGLFDPTYFLYYEDTDWCLRARQAGVQLQVAPDARLWHAVGGSFGRADAPLRRYHLARSSVLFHHRQGHVLPSLAGWIRLQRATRTAVALAARGDLPGLRAHWRGLCDGLRLVHDGSTAA